MIVFALVVVPTTAYVGAYYGLAFHVSAGVIDGRPIVARYYRQRWQSDIFKPAGRIESWLTGKAVYIDPVQDVTFE